MLQEAVVDPQGLLEQAVVLQEAVVDVLLVAEAEVAWGWLARW